MDEETQKLIIEAILAGKCTAPEGWKLSDDQTSLVEKTEDEILADDWNESIERKGEYTNYLNSSIADMEKYLTETDWYISRYTETGKEIPEDVSTTRADYRDKISEYRTLLETAENTEIATIEEATEEEATEEETIETE